MPISDNLDTYHDIERAFRLALANPNGAFQPMPGANREEKRKRAFSWRSRAYKYRELIRKENRKAYKGTANDAESLKTIYDGLKLTLTDEFDVKIGRQAEDLPMPIPADGIFPDGSVPDNDPIDLDSLAPNFDLALELAEKEGVKLK